jgi:hypothetical protein
MTWGGSIQPKIREGGGREEERERERERELENEIGIWGLVQPHLSYSWVLEGYASFWTYQRGPSCLPVPGWPSSLA